MGPYMVAIAAPMSADLTRLRNEYLAMPGLCLTVPQAARLLSIGEADARELLTALVEEGLLVRPVRGTYGRYLPVVALLDEP
jgi:Fic family protein